MSVLFSCIHGKWTWVRQWQIFRELLLGSRDLSHASPKFISHEHRKKDTHSLNQQGSFSHQWLSPYQVWSFVAKHFWVISCTKSGKTYSNRQTSTHRHTKRPTSYYAKQCSWNLFFLLSVIQTDWHEAQTCQSGQKLVSQRKVFTNEL